MRWCRDVRWSVLLYSSQADLEASPWLALSTSHGELLGRFKDHAAMLSALAALGLTLGPRFLGPPEYLFRLYYLPEGRRRAP